MRKKKLMLHFWVLPVCLVLGSLQRGHAQDRPLSGKVVGTDKAPIAGVSVMVGGGSTGTLTDENGNYFLAHIHAGDTIVFSFSGMAVQRVAVGERRTLDITLAGKVAGLGEVVVIGYGSVKRSDLTGSIASIKGEEMSSFATTTPLMALSGRSSGVQVLQNTGSPGGSISVRVRGANSIQGSNEPLYVIDGFPSSSTDPSILNTSDIQNIEVLKDASAVAIYGSRGANGVVLITTKKGKAGRTRVDYSSSYGVQSLRKQLDMMDAKQYATLYNEQAANDGQAPYFTQDQVNSFGKGYDWQDLTFRNAPIQNHSISVTGGDKKTQFAVDGSVFDQQGIIRNSSYKRYSLVASVNHDISDKFSVSYSAVLSRISDAKQESSGARFGASLISATLLAPPTLTPYNADGSYRVLSSSYSFVSEGLTNPLNFLNQATDGVASNKVLANAAVVYKPVDGLVLKIFGGIENSDDREDTYQSLLYYNSQGVASVSVTQTTSLLNENTISYSKTFGKHALSAVAGVTYQDFLITTLAGSGTGFLSDVSQTYNLGSAATPGIPQSSYTKSLLLSGLGRINYTYDDKYLLTASFRGDGSSKYSDGNKWGFFPSVAVAWKMKDEAFLRDVDFISDAKLRASWGATGSQAIQPYATLNQLYSGKTVFGDALYTTFAPGTVLPGDLKWETTDQKDIGLDAGILGNKVRLTMDYYIKNTRDLLNSVQLPSSLGFTSTIENVGQIRNQGLEIAADVNVLSGKFKWNVSGNISFNKSKVIKLYGGQDILGGYVDMLVFADNTDLLRVGKPTGVFYGYEENGYNANGNIQYKDLNKDGLINQNDKTIIGNPNPKFIYGFNSAMSYRNIELSFFFQGVQGNQLANISSVDDALVYGYGDNLLKDVYNNHWTPQNTHAKYPKITRSQSMLFSNRFIENGSYLRLRNVELAYSLPFARKWDVSWIHSMRVFVSGQNLLTVTGYSGWDPEVNSMGGANSTAQGVDYYTYPTAKSLTVGLRAGF
ncbi:MAG TPA: TonB-dependent receptor [Puia sp.]|nr:TonB-dependent receptor [Puia sp.]